MYICFQYETIFKLKYIVLIPLVLLQSCCKKNFDDLYFNAIDIQVKNTYNYSEINDSIIISQEGYLIKMMLNDNIKDAIKKINSARQSLNYCEDTEVALKNDISNLAISCNKAIWNTPAGSPLDLNPIRIFENELSKDSEIIPLTVNDWIGLINTKIQFVDFEWYVEFNEPIVSTEFLVFRFEFELIDGLKYSAKTEMVKFE